MLMKQSLPLSNKIMTSNRKKLLEIIGSELNVKNVHYNEPKQVKTPLKQPYTAKIN